MAISTKPLTVTDRGMRRIGLLGLFRVLGVLGFFCLFGSAQAQSVQSEFDFVMYLVGNGMKEEAVTAVSRTPLVGDSIDFLKGYAYYSARLLDSSAASFARVGETSPLFVEAMFFAALSNAHQQRFGQAEGFLLRVTDIDGPTRNLKNFEQAGISLLRRDMPRFDSCFALVDTTDFRIADEARSLLRVREAIAARPVKQPWVAGTLSALVPGLGKVYAGNLGEGVAAFLVTGSLMAVTAENWVKDGPTNWKTIAAGLLSAVFYVGNIYGSVATVRVNLNDFNHRNNVQILYDIHIPLRAGYRH